MESKQEETRKKFIYNYLLNCNTTKLSEDIDVPLTTVKRVLKQYLRNGDVKRTDPGFLTGVQQKNQLTKIGLEKLSQHTRIIMIFP